MNLYQVKISQGNSTGYTSLHPAETRTFPEKIQRNIYILNQIRYIQVIGKKLFPPPKKTTAPYRIGDVINIQRKAFEIESPPQQ